MKLDRGKKHKPRPVSDEDLKDRSEEDAKDERSEAEIQLQQRFKTFDHSLPLITHVLEFWDRTQLMVNRPPTPDNATSHVDDDSKCLTSRKSNNHSQTY